MILRTNGCGIVSSRSGKTGKFDSLMAVSAHTSTGSIQRLYGFWLSAKINALVEAISEHAGPVFAGKTVEEALGITKGLNQFRVARMDDG